MEIIKEGNIFESKAQTLVNTVNCMGVMGKGLALEFKIKYPEMFTAYEKICKQGMLNIGKLWIYKAENRWILNFPTKYDWRKPSQEYYLELGLEKFIETYQQRGITSVAFPLLGASNGGLLPERSLEIMTYYLEKCEIPVTIYLGYNSGAPSLFKVL